MKHVHTSYTDWNELRCLNFSLRLRAEVLEMMRYMSTLPVDCSADGSAFWTSSSTARAAAAAPPVITHNNIQALLSSTHFAQNYE